MKHFFFALINYNLDLKEYFQKENLKTYLINNKKQSGYFSRRVFLCVLLKKKKSSRCMKTKTVLWQRYLFIKHKNLKEVTLRMCLYTAVTNRSAERSFSVLKRIK